MHVTAKTFLLAAMMVVHAANVAADCGKSMRTLNTIRVVFHDCGVKPSDDVKLFIGNVRHPAVWKNPYWVVEGVSVDPACTGVIPIVDGRRPMSCSMGGVANVGGAGIAEYNFYCEKKCGT